MDDERSQEERAAEYARLIPPPVEGLLRLQERHGEALDDKAMLELDVQQISREIEVLRDRRDQKRRQIGEARELVRRLEVEMVAARLSAARSADGEPGDAPTT